VEACGDTATVAALALAEGNGVGDWHYCAPGVHLVDSAALFSFESNYRVIQCIVARNQRAKAMEMIFIP
jgi:hypothetical protein